MGSAARSPSMLLRWENSMGWEVGGATMGDGM